MNTSKNLKLWGKTTFHLFPYGFFLLPLKEKFTVTILKVGLFKLKDSYISPQQKYEVDCLDWREGAFERKK